MSDSLPPRGVPDVRGLPATGSDTIAELRRVHSASMEYWSRYSTADFFRRPAPEVWAPADQVRHLNKALKAITQGLSVPRPVLRLLFGRADRASRPFDALRADYRAVLAAGGRAGRRFAPRPLATAEQSEAHRVRLMAMHERAVSTLCDVLGRWSEQALDAYRLPHPLLGNLTAREMALFALYHNVHHVHVAERRRVASGHASDR